MLPPARAALRPVSVPAAREAGERISGTIVRAPLLELERAGSAADIYLKLENLQPIGSFKLRGAVNAMLLADPAALAAGVCTASAGNMAQGVAFSARRLGVRCRVIVPDRAPAIKIAAIERLGGEVIRVPFDVWWQAMADHAFPGVEGLFIHPFADNGVLAGNATIGLELLEDRPDLDAVIVPWGGGGLCCGIASVIRELSPGTRIVAVEVETATPLTVSRAAGEPMTVIPQPSFVDGIGGKGVSPEIWPLAQSLVDEVVVVTLAEVAEAIRLLAERARVVAEGAGGAPVAAILSGRVSAERVACVISGGNIDPARLAAILRGELP